MFKCKQCGKSLGVNEPQHCPSCGEPNTQRPVSGGRLAGLLVIGTLADLLLVGLVVGLVVVLVTWLLK